MAGDTHIHTCKCGSQIHINFTTRKITVVKRAGEKASNLDELLEQQDKEAAERERKFNDAVDQNAREKDRLNALFEEAKDKAAQDDPDERPRNIFDLD